MYLMVTARKGISSVQLAKEIGITQKSAWFMLHRLREACGGKNLTKLKGIIEIDECFVGGLEGNKHENKKLHAGRGPWAGWPQDQTAESTNGATVHAAGGTGKNSHPHTEQR